MKTPSYLPRRQQGVALLEVLVSVVILAIGLLGAVGLQARSYSALSDAGLITRTKRGRTVAVNLSPAPMREAMAWLRQYERFWTVSLDRLVALVEAEDTGE